MQIAHSLYIPLVQASDLLDLNTLQVLQAVGIDIGFMAPVVRNPLGLILEHKYSISEYNKCERECKP